jgi:hypothetical protein
MSHVTKEMARSTVDIVTWTACYKDDVESTVALNNLIKPF